jgi:hypothetical protein
MASTTDRESFLKLMGKSDEHLARGFEVLASAKDPGSFFDELRLRGLLAPERNPGPIPAAQGTVRIPFWSALPYLAAVARQSDSARDLGLARKLIAFIGEVTRFGLAEGQITDNYHTYREFAEILGSIPLDALDMTAIEPVDAWLRSRFDTSGVVSALNKGLLPKLLEAEGAAYPQLAVTILGYLVRVSWAKQSTIDEAGEPVLAADPYWVNAVLQAHAGRFGRRAGLEATKVLASALGDAFSKGGRAKWSYLFRSAVEEHTQNRHGPNVDNCLVSGLREVLLAFAAEAPGSAREVTANLLSSDSEIVRRVALFVVDQRWGTLGDLYAQVLSDGLFQAGHTHELFGLLKHRFDDFSPELRERTVSTILSLRIEAGQESDELSKHAQARWLAALAASRDAKVQKAIAQLDKGLNVGPHPEFLTYSTVGWRTPASPFEPSSLVAAAESGALARSLDTFAESGEWDAPSKRGLARGLEVAVEGSPTVFLRRLSDLTTSDAVYQAAVLRAFRTMWVGAQDSLDWSQAWPAILRFSAALIADDAWARLEKDSAGRSELVSEIGHLIEAGTRRDDHAFDAELLDVSKGVLERLLGSVKGIEKPSADPMTQAINSPRGRVLEALFNQVLRVCRLADAKRNAHDVEWAVYKDLFDREVSLIETRNYEFSTLAAAYLANIEYIDELWVAKNFESLFPLRKPDHLRCAVSGLAYGTPTRRTQEWLVRSGTLETAVDLYEASDIPGERIIERIVLGFLWGLDDLSSTAMTKVLSNSHRVLRAAWFVGTTREGIVESGIQAKVVALMKAINDALGDHEALPLMVWALAGAGTEEKSLWFAAARALREARHSFEFYSELARLAETEPSSALEILDVALKSDDEFYDFEDTVSKLLRQLAASWSKPDVQKFCDRHRNRHGIRAVYSTLRNETNSSA